MSIYVFHAVLELIHALYGSLEPCEPDTVKSQKAISHIGGAVLAIAVAGCLLTESFAEAANFLTNAAIIVGGIAILVIQHRNLEAKKRENGDVFYTWKGDVEAT